MTDTQQCRGCRYWGAVDKCCSYYLITGRRRGKEGAVCISRKTGKRTGDQAGGEQWAAVELNRGDTHWKRDFPSGSSG